MDTVILPTVEAMNFTGFLYAGLMMTAAGAKVLEFNVRMGDPETQPLMYRLDCDFAEVLISGRTDGLGWRSSNLEAGPSVCVVLASGGYPGAYKTGYPITGIADCGATVFHAGTRQGEHGLETAGGRVLGVTESGADLAERCRSRLSCGGENPFRRHALPEGHRTSRALTRYNDID